MRDISRKERKYNLLHIIIAFADAMEFTFALTLIVDPNEIIGVWRASI
jgi:hypothetical protein